MIGWCKAALNNSNCNVPYWLQELWWPKKIEGFVAMCVCNGSMNRWLDVLTWSPCSMVERLSIDAPYHESVCAEDKQMFRVVGLYTAVDNWIVYLEDGSPDLFYFPTQPKLHEPQLVWVFDKTSLCYASLLLIVHCLQPCMSVLGCVREASSSSRPKYQQHIYSLCLSRALILSLVVWEICLIMFLVGKE